MNSEFVRVVFAVVRKDFELLLWDRYFGRGQ
jgi:hypothetical protein